MKLAHYVAILISAMKYCAYVYNCSCAAVVLQHMSVQEGRAVIGPRKRPADSNARKRPADSNARAFSVVNAIGESAAEPESRYAVSDRKGGFKGGPSRVAALSPERHTEIVKQARAARSQRGA